LKNILQQLEGGDRRSIRGVAEVVNQVLVNPDLFPVLFGGMADADPLVRMRCADAVEKITAVHPDFLALYKTRVIRLAAIAEQQEVRWHLAQLFARLKLSARERRRVVEILFGYLKDTSRIVKTFAMQALAEIAAQDSELRAPIVKRLRTLTRTGSPAMKSRGRRLLARLSEMRSGSTNP
jgi:hypothetical protein